MLRNICLLAICFLSVVFVRLTAHVSDGISKYDSVETFGGLGSITLLFYCIVALIHYTRKIKNNTFSGLEE